MKNYKELSDSTLVELTLLGDERAYEELVIRHERSVKGTAYKMTGNTYSAEDAAQDAFVSAWLNLDSLSDRDRFGAWVCSIAKNHARNLVRRYRNTAADISLSLLEEVDLTGSDESGLYELLSAASIGEDERDERLHEALAALGEKIRETVHLHYFEGLSVSQIAERLSLPAGTVKWRLCEGRRQLRKEYGIMEKEYNENEDVVARVMRQVEKLKLWALKSDKEGFEEDYNAVLANVTALADSKEKSHALADVLLRGFWWIPGKRNDEVFAEIKAAAIAGHNDDVMQAVVGYEHDKLKGQERIDLMRNTQIPWLEENGYTKSLGYVWFWLGREIWQDITKGAEALECMNKVLEVLTPSDIYYANALAAIPLIKKYTEKLPLYISATGEELRYIDGKLCFWQQPGFSQGYFEEDIALFYYASQCDSIIYDPDLKTGESIVSKNGIFTLTCTARGITVETPAGVFEDCTELTLDGPQWRIDRVTTYFCENVGIVSQKYYSGSRKHEYEWVLAEYGISGGEGIIPFAPGNYWSYAYKEGGDTIPDSYNRVTVTAADCTSAILSVIETVDGVAYNPATWRGAMLDARHSYYSEDEKGKEHIRPDVLDKFARVATLASTKREKRHTEIATDVMRRIITCNPEYPDYTERGCWNFFEYEGVIRENGKVTLADFPNRDFSFEWKEIDSLGWDGHPIYYNFLYDMIEKSSGYLWNDEWTDGYTYEGKPRVYGYDCEVTLKVTREDCEIGIGKFTDCIHVSSNLRGLGNGIAYQGGKKDYWYAPGIGIIRMEALYKKGERRSVWELVSYTGEGEKTDYFPTADGMVRRYEPIGLREDFRAAVEYTFDVEDDSIYIFRNALGNQTRAGYEKYLAEKAKKEAEKKKKDGE